jgi:CheY-specific phosphatase CheX
MSSDKNLLINSLSEAVAETFEEMAFAEVERYEKIDSFPQFSKKDFLATIELKNPGIGMLHIVIGENYAYELTKSLLGEDSQEIADPLVIDSLAEIANTIGGSYLRFITQDNQSYELGIPVSCRITDMEPVYNEKTALNMAFDIEDNKIYVMLTNSQN